MARSIRGRLVNERLLLADAVHELEDKYPNLDRVDTATKNREYDKLSEEIGKRQKRVRMLRLKLQQLQLTAAQRRLRK